MSRWVSLGLVLALASGVRPAAAVSVCGGGDPVKEAAAQSAWRNYADSLAPVLTASTSPRDWVLSVTTFDTAPGPHGIERMDVFARAMNAAPDDALVQWIVRRFPPLGGDSVKLRAQALRNLEHIEPDNAAVWNEALEDALYQKDDTAIAAALQRMGGSSHFTKHAAAIESLIEDAMRRTPMSDTDFAAQQATRGAGFTRDDAAFAASTLFIDSYWTVGNDAFQVACMNTATEHAERRIDCAQIGRLLVSQADHQETAEAGADLLRHSDALDASDIDTLRSWDWLSTQYMKLRSRSVESPVVYATSRAFHADWLATQSEPEAMRRTLTREHIAPQLAPDWIDSGLSADAVAERAPNP